MRPASLRVTLRMLPPSGALAWGCRRGERRLAGQSKPPRPLAERDAAARARRAPAAAAAARDRHRTAAAHHADADRAALRRHRPRSGTQRAASRRAARWPSRRPAAGRSRRAAAGAAADGDPYIGTDVADRYQVLQQARRRRHGRGLSRRARLHREAGRAQDPLRGLRAQGRPGRALHARGEGGLEDRPREHRRHHRLRRDRRRARSSSRWSSSTARDLARPHPRRRRRCRSSARATS